MIFGRLSLRVALAALVALVAVPTARASVSLLYFRALSGSDAIRLEWETASELDNLGFNLYRADSNNFASALQINSSLIPSKVGGQPTGAYYLWTDEDVVSGKLYTYWLESVDLFGDAVLHDPVQAAVAGGSTIPTPFSGSPPAATPMPTGGPTRTPTRTPTVGTMTPVGPAVNPTATPRPPTNQTAATPTTAATRATGSGSSGSGTAAPAGGEQSAGPLEARAGGGSFGPSIAVTTLAGPPGTGSIAVNVEGGGPAAPLAAARPLGVDITSLEAATPARTGLVPTASGNAAPILLAMSLGALAVVVGGGLAAYLITRRPRS